MNRGPQRGPNIARAEGEMTQLGMSHKVEQLLQLRHDCAQPEQMGTLTHDSSEHIRSNTKLKHVEHTPTEV